MGKTQLPDRRHRFQRRYARRFTLRPHEKSRTQGSLLDSVGFGLGGRLGLRVYMTGFAPTGLYVSTEFTLLAQELQGLPGDWRLRVDAAMGIAYQHIVAGRFALSAGIAATLISSSPIVAQLVGPLRITVGFAF